MEDNPIEFENHFLEKVIEVRFPHGYRIDSLKALENLKTLWIANLKSWHTPYTCLFDLNDFYIDEKYTKDFEAMVVFFKNFFMKKIIGFYETELKSPVGFTCIQGYEKAIENTGLSRTKQQGDKKITDFRSLIQIENDFNSHAVEISFRDDTNFSSKEEVDILLSKLKNNLMQWHTPYNVLINCFHCSFSPVAQQEFLKIEKFLKSFFCKKIIGYNPKKEKSSYPFPVFRSKHAAALELEHSGLVSGEIANCASKKFNSTTGD
ncbi:MAG: hypothetical protein K2X39_05650 [Silvanigrellaceae bacterium]|nr:hypothetical protein [Silvanigrellaceae bacterium]